MANLHTSILIEDFLVHLHHSSNNGAVEVGLPGTILTSVFNLQASHREAALLHLLKIFHHRLVAGTAQDKDTNLSGAYVNDTQVTAGLNYSRNTGNMTQHTVMTGHNSIHQIVLDFYGHLSCRHICILYGQGNTFFHSAELILECLLAILSQILQVVQILLRDTQYHCCSSWDSITHITTVPSAETSLVIGNSLTDETGHQLVGICSAFIDFQTAVSATKALQCNLNGNISFFWNYLFILHGGRNVHAACRTDDEFTHRLIIDIEQDITFQRVGCQMVYAIHGTLFVGSNQCLQWPMLKVGTLHNSHNGSYTHTVI